ncbi:hypothetical protein BDR07DRAFT_1494739 [Suillus spraguei]|nr:hypothetical protein BDR07DRAFT_1494739 [Suillus spraguei]
MSRYADCMPAIFGLLFREIYQWHSLEIISDTWMPIHSALQLLNERRTEGPSALRLESIKLQRTNDYLSRFWLFCPAKMFQRSLPPPQTVKHNSIWRSPELEKLSSLYSWCNSQSLYPVAGALLSQRRSILEACPRLQNLILRFSGPLGGFPRQVSLPLLQELHYGYFCVGDDIRLFSGFRAPNLIKLTLENRSSCRALYLPAEDDGEDDKANSLLKYCATHLLFPKLEELSLYSVNASVDTFTLFMEPFPAPSSAATLHTKCTSGSVTHPNAFGRCSYILPVA